MKVLLIVLPYGISSELEARHKLRSFVAHPYGVLSIATYLDRNTDAEVRVFDCNVKGHEFRTDLLNEVEDFKPDIAGLSMMFDCSYWSVKPITSAILELAPNCKIVIGGAAATASYDTVLKEQPDISAVCYGEGELAFANLVNCGMFKHSSWATREYKPSRNTITDLDEVIDIDYSFINIDDYPMQESFSPYANKQAYQRQFFVVTSRGCAFDCNFCINSANPDKSMRYASVDKIIEHVIKLIDTYDMNVLTFYDDQILFNKKRAKELFRRLIPFKLRIECPNGLSVAFIDDELAGYMRAAGMDTACLAIESASPHILNDIINKPLKIGMVKPVVDILHKHGFWVQGYFVIGLPDETTADRELTRKAIKEWELDWACISNACPTRGSRLYRQCIENGYIPKDMGISDLDMNKFIITTPSRNPEYLVRESYLINLDVNFINSRAMRMGKYDIALKVFQDVLKRYPDHAIAYYCVSVCADNLFKEKVAASSEWLDYSRQMWLC